MEHSGNADSFGLYKTPSLIKASRRIYTCHRLNYEPCWTNNLHLLFWRSSSALKYFKAQTSSIDSIPEKFESCIPFLLSDSKHYFLKWSLLPAQQKLLACFYDLKSLRDDLIIKISYLAWKYYKYRRLGWHCKPICLAATSLPLVTSANENRTCFLALCLCFPSVFSVYFPFSTALCVPETTAAHAYLLPKEFSDTVTSQLPGRHWENTFLWLSRNHRILVLEKDPKFF